MTEDAPVWWEQDREYTLAVVAGGAIVECATTRSCTVCGAVVLVRGDRQDRHVRWHTDRGETP